jgi:hypothetical protein
VGARPGPRTAGQGAPRWGTAAWLLGVGALLEVVGLLAVVTGALDVGGLMLRADPRADPRVVAEVEPMARGVLVAVGVTATVVWLCLAGAVAVGARWARWLATGYALVSLGVTAVGLGALRDASAALGLLQAAVAVGVLVALWTPCLGRTGPGTRAHHDGGGRR